MKNSPSQGYLWKSSPWQYNWECKDQWPSFQARAVSFQAGWAASQQALVKGRWGKRTQSIDLASKSPCHQISCLLVRLLTATSSHFLLPIFAHRPFELLVRNWSWTAPPEPDLICRFVKHDRFISGVILLILFYYWHWWCRVVCYLNHIFPPLGLLSDDKDNGRIFLILAVQFCRFSFFFLFFFPHHSVFVVKFFKLLPSTVFSAGDIKTNTQLLSVLPLQ